MIIKSQLKENVQNSYDLDPRASQEALQSLYRCYPNLNRIFIRSVFHKHLLNLDKSSRIKKYLHIFAKKLADEEIKVKSENEKNDYGNSTNDNSANEDKKEEVSKINPAYTASSKLLPV
ncbi:MAG: hypothetical protein QXW70_03850 [Candidatus Anstonellales archaeon]